jgi:hypothetical protein
MVLHIIIEVVLAFATILASQAFWQLRKRERFLRWAIHNPPLLESLLSRDTLSNPLPRILLFAEKNEVGYVLNMKCVEHADRSSQWRTTIFFGIAVAAILIGSYSLGISYLAINFVLSLLTASFPLSPSARANAIEHIFTIALILHKWRLDNATECDEWITYARSLQPLYEAVKNAQ